MLRLESDNGWWLITHPDHAHLAGEFARHWGNGKFRSPQPREQVLLAIHAHDDGWAARDAAPSLTRQGKPSAFSVELVGKYSAFEEIDLADYLAVRNRAVLLMADREPYAAILISMHTCNLLTQHADRSSIAPEQLPMLDSFVEEQLALQKKLLAQVRSGARFTREMTTDETIREHFHLLQACDNLSLLTCVDYAQPSSLLHALPLNNGDVAPVKVTSIGHHHFRLAPYPFGTQPLTIEFPARHIVGKEFSSAADLQHRFHKAEVQTLSVTLSE